MQTIHYHPQGVCAKTMEADIEDGVIREVRVLGGCSGNMQGLCALLKGMEVEEAIGRLSGIRCGQRDTSCPDQMARALQGTIPTGEECSVERG
jgi:uncharacterized protein (TIGR03905 family)